uniref:E3 ubiquitin-protein ligase E3D n=1 Tax=Canis lupus familiaris TaxID=9615 RepID=A0A8P0PFK9_CANLF
RRYCRLLGYETRLCFGVEKSWEVSARLHLLHPSCRALPASFPPTLVKGVYSAQIFKVGSWESSASGPAHRKKSGRAVGLSLPTFVSPRTQASIRKGSRPQVESRRLRVLRPAGGAVGWRAVSAQGSGREARAAAAAAAARVTAPAVVAARPPHLRLGARHGGGCGGDARVPGGAETAAERAAHPRVRPALGAWAPRHRALAGVSAGPGASASLGGTSCDFLPSCLEPVICSKCSCSSRTLLDWQSRHHLGGEPKEGGVSMDISITPSSLQVKTPEGCTELQLPAEVRLVPSSCGGLRYVPGDGLHLRLQVRAESNAKLVSMFNQSSQAQECCTFYCQSCGEVIIRDRLSSAWESDISIHSLTLPSATCLELLLILSRNNATLPPSLRYMNSFQVAFLKM